MLKNLLKVLGNCFENIVHVELLAFFLHYFYFMVISQIIQMISKKLLYL